MSTLTPRRSELPKAYDPKQVEERWYHFWLEKGFFTPNEDPSKKPFVVIMPPPNVTGELHLGHALTAAIEDALTRWHRMLGESALWLPGCDHAGIATQFVVEKELLQQGLTRHQLGREEFERRVWQWVGKYIQGIRDQHQRLGASCDWTRERFTLDEGPSSAVRTTFVKLYKKGLIYRGERIINWCPRCATALSDLEVVHEESQGNLWHLRYPLQNSPGFVTVATTRPETYLGDTAVAVHPQDQRYRDLVGRQVVLPVIGRVIPIIADEAVDREFGTGAVKVTPHHDPTDFEIGLRHQLSRINVMNPDGTMNGNAGPFQGKDRFQCREAVIGEFQRQGLMEKIESQIHAVGLCDRCRTVVEPTVSLQWFVNIKPLAEPAIDAVKDNRVQIIPERFTKVYLNWMENIRDWCISRQLWWGHRIPVWYCRRCEKETVVVDTPSTCEHCGSQELEQDQDVLDTWFSSALWPHSTLGWPQDTKDLLHFYPTSVMETGYDILFFWVARMLMLGLENTGQVPFQYVYLHGLIRDEHGDKMSKVRGNVINPTEAIETYGCDALRFSLLAGISPGNDTRLSPQKLEAGRNFANKLWNTARYVFRTLEEADHPQDLERLPEKLHPEDRWIVSRLHRLVEQVNQLMDRFQLGQAEQEVHQFLWGEFCDWYLERSKIRIRNRAIETEPLPYPILAYVLEKTLRLLHPFMPFITEEVWQALKGYLKDAERFPESIMIAPFPSFESHRDLVDEEAELRIQVGNQAIQAIRNARSEFKVSPSTRATATISGQVSLLEGQLSSIASLANTEVDLLQDFSPSNPNDFRIYILDHIQVHVNLPGMVDVEQERQGLQREAQEARAALQGLEARLSDAQFLTKAPREVVERQQQRAVGLQERLQELEQRLGQAK